jgi:hypothetical protein
MKKTSLALAISMMVSAPAFSAAFVNGGFEDGNFGSWTTGGGYRAGVNNASLNPADFLPGGALYNANLNHSAIVTQGIAPHTDGNLNQVYSGTYSARVEDTINGGYASVIRQTVTGYSDPSIFFAWAAVLEGAHGTNSAATFILTLTDDTLGTTLVNRQYNAASGGGGVDQRFTLSGDGYFYTDWQIEQLDVSGAQGHDFTLSLLAADCQPTGHAGYVYLDGFGAQLPPVGTVPEPATLALLGLGAVGLGVSRRRKPA